MFIAPILIAASACPASAEAQFGTKSARSHKLRWLLVFALVFAWGVSHATTYTRDAQGNAPQETTPDAGTTQTTYDALGLPQRSVDALGRVIRIERDALGRPTHIVHSTGAGGVQTRVLRYDLPGTLYNLPEAPNASQGRLSELRDDEAITRYRRDSLGRIVRKAQLHTSGEQRIVNTSYIPAGQGGAGQVKAISYPSGRQLVHQYDATGQLTGMRWNGQPLVSNITWNPLGQPTGWQWNGFSGSGSTPLAEVRSYNTAGQLTGSALLDLTWDAAGRVSQIKQQHMLPGTTQAQQAAITSAYSYDAVGRLTASAHSGTPDLTLPAGTTLADTLGIDTSGYSYDANGNRSQVYYAKATPGGTATLQRNYQIVSGSNRLSGYAETLQMPGGGAQTTNITYSHDATGAITKKGDSYLHYGVDGRIAKVSLSQDPNATQAVSYKYNALGQRIAKIDARLSATSPITQQTVYADDGEGSTVLGSYSSQRSNTSAAPQGENDSTEIIYLPTAAGPMPIAAQINGRLYAIDADHLNTPRRLTNQQGQVVWQWLITGFGEVNPTMGAAGYTQENNGPSYSEEITFNLRYPGQQWDEETGLSYNLNRYFDRATGRYMQFDPIGLAGGWNGFGYAAQNPLIFTDPDGLLEIYRGDGVTFNAYPGPQAGGIEHARQGPGESYHIHLRDGAGREARLSSETWKPLTSEDKRIFDSSRQMQRACENLTDGQKKFFDRVNREVFHRGVPTTNQLLRLIPMRPGGGGSGGRGNE